MFPQGVGVLTVFDNMHIRYTVISCLMYVDKQCPHWVGHFLCFDISQYQFPYVSRGREAGVLFD